MKAHIKQLKLEKKIIMIHPGEIRTTGKDEVISTLLGSCVAVCMRDKTARVSGMNHFLLPGTDKDFTHESFGRYGISSMENLINQMLKLGASKHRMQAKIFGGSRMMAGFNSDIGKKNIEFVKWFMKNEKIPITMEDVGSNSARKIYFFTENGDVYVEKIETRTSKEVVTEEVNYFKKAKNRLEDSDITIF